MGLSKKDLERPEVWALLKDGETLRTIAGDLGAYREGNYIKVTGGYFIGEIRDEDGIGRSWVGSQPLVKRQGDWTVDIHTSEGLYRRDGDNIKDRSGNIVAWISKRYP